MNSNKKNPPTQTNHPPDCREILLCFLQQKINDLISLELDRLHLPNKAHHWTHLKMQSCFGKLSPLHHKAVVLVSSDLFSHACVLLNLSKHLFCKMGPLTFYSLVSCNRLHIVIFCATGSAVLFSHSSPAHPFPDSKLFVQSYVWPPAGPRSLC